MAPERFDGRSDRRSDVYGLGITLYELLTLRPAFDAAQQAALIHQVLHGAPTSPRQIDRRIPRDLETIVLKAMAKEPSARYASAHALGEDLRRFLENRTILARRSTSLERTRSLVPPQPGRRGAAHLGRGALDVHRGLLLGLGDAVQAPVRAGPGRRDRRSREALHFVRGAGAGQPVQPPSGPAVRRPPRPDRGGEDPPHARAARRSHRLPGPARPGRDPSLVPRRSTASAWPSTRSWSGMPASTGTAS